MITIIEMGRPAHFMWHVFNEGKSELCKSGEGELSTGVSVAVHSFLFLDHECTKISFPRFLPP